MTSSNRRPDSDIPTSSMADIAFLLIVFFMVTITFSAQQGLDFRPPEEDPDATTVDPVEAVLIEIQPDGELSLDGQPTVLNQLLDQLGPRLRKNPKKPIILLPRGDSTYGRMVEVFDTLRGAKTYLNLASEPQIALPSEREIVLYW